jgi:glycosyltransferase involved in cell wall biosynthesis
VFPSLWYEGAPLTVSEALANGLPCVISDACASRDAIVDRETGLLFRSGDKEDLRARIAELQNPQVADRIGRAAYDRYWADPQSVDAHIEALLKLYENMLRGPS